MLGLVAVPAAGAAVLAAGISIAASAGELGGEPISGQPLKEPPMLRSRNGVLKVDLDAKEAVTGLGGRNVRSSGMYNALMPGPTLVVRPGDRLQITSRNGLTQPTNLHTHGLHVSPKGNGDNVFVNSPPGATYVNQYDIPDDHIPGLYWYHPHRHMYTDPQVTSGMAGAIVVEGKVDALPQIARARTRTMIFQQFQVNPDGAVVDAGQASNAPLTTYVNGQFRPVIAMRPGETQRWRMANMTADNFLRIPIPAGLDAWLLATDGTPVNRLSGVQSMLLAPGARRTILVRARTTGDVALRSADFGTDFQAAVATDLATVRIEGERAADQGLPAKVYDMPDLRDERVAARRTLRFSEGLTPGGDPLFFINGKMFDQWGKRDLATMKLNTVEEWTLTNASFEYHPFHIHIQPFQVISVNGVPVKGVDYRDVISIPPAVSGVPGRVVIRQKYTDFTGRFVVHCHILFHEDNGLMAPVSVVR